MATTYERVPVMPTPQSSLEGTIYKYAGTTNDLYTRGKYYKCVIDNFFKQFNWYGGTSTSLEYVWNNNKGVNVNVKIVVQDGYLSPIKINGNIVKGTAYSGTYNYILNSGDVLTIGYTPYPTWNITLDWYKWQEVEVDEHDTVKYFSDENVAYLLSELTERIKQAHINE